MNKPLVNNLSGRGTGRRVHIRYNYERFTIYYVTCNTERSKATLTLSVSFVCRQSSQTKVVEKLSLCDDYFISILQGQVFLMISILHGQVFVIICIFHGPVFVMLCILHGQFFVMICILHGQVFVMIYILHGQVIVMISILQKRL